MKRNVIYKLSFAALLAVTLLAGLPASTSAQEYPYQSQRYEYYYSPAQENGYRLGFGAGSNDRAFGNQYDMNDHKDFRDGDSGYRSQYGSKNAYENMFRQAYEQGYRDGFSGRRSRLVDYRNRPYDRRPRWGRWDWRR